MKYRPYTLSVAIAIAFCSLLSADLNDHVGAVSKINNLIQSGEKKKALTKLDSLHESVVRKRAKLRGLRFSGSVKTLTDPVYIPEGTYRVHYSTNGLGIVDVLDMKGNRISDLFAFGDGADDATTVYRSEGEKVMIKIKDGQFELYFEKLN